jgi:uncharacterized protein YyaL (SSP411 family)
MNKEQKEPNRLINESSPYLLQHAYNPVDWYAWCDEALQRARKENKPILVSIGYSSCHWCHVMEKESFEDDATAAIMNGNFINIKIDREERPDLDHIYMDAVQAMTGSGGWPLNVFLTPGLKPFYGGTYFPPVQAYNRASWKEVLLGVAEAFTKRRDEIDAQADHLIEHLEKSNSFGTNPVLNISIPAEEKFTKQQQETIFQNITRTADKEYGGFGTAPKFPSTFVIGFLLRHYHFTKNEEALQQACLSLDKMICGGIYDQIGGGFARYSTDKEWLVPHFEKMLYDNALLVIVLSEAYQVTKKELYQEAIIRTLDFIKREFTSSEGGFYSALDADSEGTEGKYYVWTKKEIEEVLGSDAMIFCNYYDVTDKGNWEKQNILRVITPMSEFAISEGINERELKIKLARCRNQLLAVRSKRIKPGLDDKILLGWNALMNKAYSKAFAALGCEEYRQAAINNMDFLLEKFGSKGLLHHTYKNREAKINAFADDHAYLLDALIHLQEITGNQGYLEKAAELMEKTLAGFSDPGTGFLYFTSLNQADAIIRKKEIYDGATPSANSVMAGNLYYLGMIFGNQEWINRAVTLTESVLPVVTRYPGSFALWAQVMQHLTAGIYEIALIGKDFQQKMPVINAAFIPNKILQVSVQPLEGFPLLAGKENTGNTLFYLCRNYSCRQPVSDFTELWGWLN